MQKYKLYRSLLRRCLLHVYYLQGTFEDDPLRVVVADDGTTLDYVKRLAFPNGVSVTKKKWISALRAPNLMKSDADLVVVGVNRLLMDRYVSRGFRIIPKWLRLYFPVTEEPMERIKSFGRRSAKHFRGRLNKAQQSGCEVEVVTDKSWLAHFYHEMYKPYALQRFEDGAFIRKPRQLRKLLKGGFFVVSKRNDQPLAAVLTQRRGDALLLASSGVTGGDIEIMKEGVLFATHYHAVQMAHSAGCRVVDFGCSRAFLSDGTLGYKLFWHMDVGDSDDTIPGVFAVATPGDTPQGIRFLETNPHFYLDGGVCRRSDEVAEQSEDGEEAVALSPQASPTGGDGALPLTPTLSSGGDEEASSLIKASSAHRKR